MLLGSLELPLTPPMGKCWNEEEGKPRAFVLREPKTSSACPWVQLLQTLQIGLVFCFAFKCFFSQCHFFFHLFFWLEGVSLRESQSGALHLAHQAYPQSMHKPSPLGCISSRIPCGFAMAKPSCLVPKMERPGRAGQLCCVLQPSANSGSVRGGGTLGRLQL